MKQLTTLIMLLCAVSVYGAITVSNYGVDPSFAADVAQMYNDREDLYVTDSFQSISGPLYDEVYFDSSESDFWTDTSPGLKNPNSVADKVFKHVSNFSSFLMLPNGVSDVAFIGNSGVDVNELSLKVNSPETTSVELFTYDRDAVGSGYPNPPSSVKVTNTYNSTASLSFVHDDQSVGVVMSQSNPLKFKVFQAIDPNTGSRLSGEYMFTIDDRTNNAVDFDDGIFYVKGDLLTPVPEPSQTMLLLSISLIVLFHRKTLR